VKIASVVLASAVLSLGAFSLPARAQEMSFFITSVGAGDGGNLGGLEGADAHCQKLAEAAGSTGKTWRAYLSTQAEGKRGDSARLRIGHGPWYNAAGELIAVDLDQLHILPNIYLRTALDENGNRVKGRYDDVNQHDILTGTQEDGMAFWPWQEGDKTCSNWTSNNEGSAIVGHHDRHGGGNTSWNSAHASRGCSPDALASSGGAGLFYCFATD